jgi:hypothetical protein
VAAGCSAVQPIIGGQEQFKRHCDSAFFNTADKLTPCFWAALKWRFSNYLATAFFCERDFKHRLRMGGVRKVAEEKRAPLLHT